MFKLPQVLAEGMVDVLRPTTFVEGQLFSAQPVVARMNVSGGRPCRIIIIGDRRDPHVAAVADRTRNEGLVIVDAATLPSRVIRAEPALLLLRDETGNPVVMSPDVATRGWTRRFAPAGWDTGLVLGSHGAAAAAGRYVILGAILRATGARWLSRLDRLTAAENKLIQYEHAARLGVPVPMTQVLTDEVRTGIPTGRVLLKPLGPGSYGAGSADDAVVFVQDVDVADLTGIDLLAAPFLVQTRISVRTHLRVVTVEDQAWVAQLDADGLPLDWRADARAHFAWVGSSEHEALASRAIALASSLGCGFSSQDWLVSDECEYFVDLNPGGQWQFLPDTMAREIAAAIADWLAREA